MCPSPPRDSGSPKGGPRWHPSALMESGTTPGNPGPGGTSPHSTGLWVPLAESLDSVKWEHKPQVALKSGWGAHKQCPKILPKEKYVILSVLQGHVNALTTPLPLHVLASPDAVY